MECDGVLSEGTEEEFKEGEDEEKMSSSRKQKKELKGMFWDRVSLKISPRKLRQGPTKKYACR